MHIKISYSLFILAVVLLFSQCKKEIAKSIESDQALLLKAEQTANFYYYKSDNAVYRSSPQAAHAGYFRVRFNDRAQSVLTDVGKLPAGSYFPEGSIIVKELLADSSGNNIIGYAVIEKSFSDPNANQGWIWAEYVTGSNGYKINGKGSICVSCHSMNDRDKVRVFNLFP